MSTTHSKFAAYTNIFNCPPCTKVRHLCHALSFKKKKKNGGKKSTFLWTDLLSSVLCLKERLPRMTSCHSNSFPPASQRTLLLSICTSSHSNKGKSFGSKTLRSLPFYCSFEKKSRRQPFIVLFCGDSRANFLLCQFPFFTCTMSQLNWARRRLHLDRSATPVLLSTQGFSSTTVPGLVFLMLSFQGDAAAELAV